jgi:hypothetical protein
MPLCGFPEVRDWWGDIKCLVAHGSTDVRNGNACLAHDVYPGGSCLFPRPEGAWIVLAEGSDEDGLDGVQAVFGLVEHDAGV